MPEVKNVSKTEINFIDMPNAVQSNVAVVNVAHLKMGHPDYFATRLANKIFGGGSQGRLFQNLREDKGYTYGAYSGFGSNERTATTFKSSAKVRNMVTDSSIVEILKESKLFKTNKVSEKELQDAKASYVGNFVMALESPATAANYALDIVIKDLPENFYETYLQKINAVTVDDIQRVANTYFKPENARIIVVGKALDVLPNLEKLSIPIKYFDKEVNSTSKPEMTRPIPDGVSVKTITDKFLNAVGGMDKISKVNSTFSVAEATIQGISLIMSSKSMAPNKTAVIISGMGQVLSKSVFNGETGYIEQQGLRTEMDEKQLEKSRSNVIPFPELGFANDPEVSLTQIEVIDGKDAYVLKKGDDTTIYYDVETGLKLKMMASVEAAGGQTIEQTFTFEDYKEIEGILFPFKMGMTVGPQHFDFKVKEIRLNRDVVESDFE